LGIREIYRLRDEAKQSNTNAPLAFIVDSLKHPEEERALRSVYVNGFYLVSVVCHPDIRRRRLKMKFKGTHDGELDDFIVRDEAAKQEHGQQVRKTLHKGDFFVSNDADETGAQSGDLSEAPLADALERFVNIVLQIGVVRPTKQERGMYAAWAASLRSACLSRQVGAAILDKDGEVLSTGTNDVPKYGGGLYQDDDGKDDHRCYRWTDRTGKAQCHNDATKADIYNSLSLGSRAMADNHVVEGASTARHIRVTTAHDTSWPQASTRSSTSSHTRRAWRLICTRIPSSMQQRRMEGSTCTSTSSFFLE
jgi:deoxycytidylate deaminase